MGIFHRISEWWNKDREEIADEAFKTLLRGWVDKFADWIARLKQPALSF